MFTGYLIALVLAAQEQVRDVRKLVGQTAMHGIFPVPKGVRSITLKLGQAQRKGTPQNGSAARVKDVEARLFDTRSDAAAYVATYNALYDSVK